MRTAAFTRLAWRPAVIPLATGCIGLLGLRDPLYLRCGVPVGLDSNLRFYSGLWLGLGCASPSWFAPAVRTAAAPRVNVQSTKLADGVTDRRRIA